MKLLGFEIIAQYSNDSFSSVADLRGDKDSETVEFEINGKTYGLWLQRIDAPPSILDRVRDECADGELRADLDQCEEARWNSSYFVLRPYARTGHDVCVRLAKRISDIERCVHAVDRGELIVDVLCRHYPTVMRRSHPGREDGKRFDLHVRYHGISIAWHAVELMIERGWAHQRGGWVWGDIVVADQLTGFNGHYDFGSEPTTSPHQPVGMSVEEWKRWYYDDESPNAEVPF